MYIAIFIIIFITVSNHCRIVNCLPTDTAVEIVNNDVSDVSDDDDDDVSDKSGVSLRRSSKHFGL